MHIHHCLIMANILFVGYYTVYTSYDNYFVISSLLQILEMQDSAQHKGHLALYNCLVLGHTKFPGVQRIYCNPFPAKRSTAVTDWTLS